MQKLLLSLIALVSFNTFTMQLLKIEGSRLAGSENPVALYHHDSVGFAVERPDGMVRAIPGYDIDPVLRGKSSALVKAFYDKGGSLSLHKMDNGDISVQAHARGLGAGPVGYAVGLWGTRVTGWVAFGALVLGQPR